MSDVHGCCVCSCYARGMQDAAYDTYADNMLATVRPDDYHVTRAELVRGPDRFVTEGLQRAWNR